MKTHLMQTSFTGGELSPKLEGRIDIQKYGQSVKTMENLIPLPYGGALKRPGTYFVNEVKTSSLATRLIPFQFSTTQAYILEFGNLYIRFYKDNGRIIKTLADTADWATTTKYSVGDYVESGSTIYYCIVAHTSTSGAFSTDLSAGKWVAQTIYELPTPYLTADLFELQFTQSADVLYICHRDYTPNKLSRTGHNAWTLTAMSVDGGPWMPDNLTNITMTAGATTGATTLTAGAPNWATATKYKVGDYVTESAKVYKCLVSHLSGTFATDKTALKWVETPLVAFTSADVGRLMKMAGTVGTDPDDIQGYLEITGYSSATVVNATVRRTLSASTATTDWAYGAWSDRTGYPGVCTFYEQRLFLASTNSQPQTVWASYTGEFENFTTGDKDDEALDYTIYSEQVNQIKWMVAGKTLHIGTTGGGFTLDSGSQSEPLTPTNVVVLRETAYGSANLPAKKIANNVYYVQRDLLRVREIAYNFQQDSYLAPDITIFSDHITGTGIKDVDYQQSPHNLMWNVRLDGEVAILDREIEQDVLGWSRIVTDGVIESIAVIPNGSEDQVWQIVQRTINGSVKRYVEYYKPFDWGDDQEDEFFVDCGLTYDSTAVSSVSGLTHLAGETVSILTDGAVHPPKVVSNAGVVTLDWSASVIHIGLPYTATLTLNRPEVSDPKQTTQAMQKKIAKVTVRLYKSGSFDIGDEDLQDEINFRTSAMDMDAPVELFTGDREVEFAGDYSKSSRVKVVQSQPLPLHIEAIVMEIAFN